MKKASRWLACIIILASLFCMTTQVFAATSISTSGTTIKVADTTDSSVLYSLQCTLSQTVVPVTGGNSSTTNGGTSASWDDSSMFTVSAKNSTYSGFLSWKYYAQNYSAALTITNPSDGPTLKIVYTASQLDSGNGENIPLTLDPGDSIRFVKSTSLEEKDKETKTSTTVSGYVTIVSITSVTSADIIFDSSSKGSYSYTVGESTTQVAAGAAASEPVPVAPGSKVTLTKGTASTDDYTFYGWMQSGKLLGTADGEYAINDSGTIYPVYLPTETITAGAPFKVGNNYHMFWHLAFADAKASGNMVVLYKNATLPSTLEDTGLCENHTYSDYVTGADGSLRYMVPSGTRFLVPYGSGDGGNFSTEPNNYTITEEEVCNLIDAGTRNTVYRRLTVSIGALIDCYGQINVNGQRQSDGQPYTGVSAGGYGKIILGAEPSDMDSYVVPTTDSLTDQLIIRSGGILYCYGYITGSGMVRLEGGVDSNGNGIGGQLYEFMQVCDFPGGSNATGWSDAAKKSNVPAQFVLSQYYVQNVEAPLKIEHGATTYIEAALTLSGVTAPASAAYIGVGSGVFQISQGASVYRIYDVKQDRMNYHLFGTNSLGAIQIYKEVYTLIFGAETHLGTIDLNSSDYILPLGSNLSVIVESGATLSSNQKIALLPGSEVIVKAGGTVNISNQIYLWDVNDWTNGYFFNRLSMTTTTGGAADSTSKCANQSSKFAPLPYVATLHSISPRSADAAIVRGSTVKDSTVTQRYYLSGKDITTSGRLEINGTVNATGNGALCVTNISGKRAANIAVTGTGVINYNGTVTVGSLGTGYGGTITKRATTCGLGNLAGVGTLKAFSNGTYYGQANGYWYNYVVTADNVANFNVTAGATGLDGNTVSRYNTATPATRTEINNVIGYVSKYCVATVTTDSEGNETATYEHLQSTFQTGLTTTDGSWLGYTGGGTGMQITPSVQSSGTQHVFSYGLSGVGADVYLYVSNTNATIIQLVAANASYVPISSTKITFPANANLSNFYTDKAGNKASSANIGSTVYHYVDAVAVIGPDATTYVSAYMNIAEAVTAATGSNTYVTVLMDRTLTTAIVVAQGQDITLDLGGKTLTGKVATVFGGAKSKKLVTNNGTLRLINGTITFDGSYTTSEDYSEANYAATLYNLGTIVYIEGVTLEETTSSIYGAALLNGSTGTVKEIRSGTLKGSDGSKGTGILNHGTINTIGTSGKKVEIIARRSIRLVKGKIDTIGGDGSTVTVTSNQRAIEVASASASIGTIGKSGSTVNITMIYAEMGRYAIYGSGGPIEVIGGKNSTITIRYESGPIYTQTAIWLTKAPASGESIIGDEGSTIIIDAQMAIAEAHASKNYDLIGIQNNVTVAIGAAKSKIYINVTQNGSGLAKGIYNAGKITSLGKDDATIEIVSNYDGIYNTGTINTIQGNLVSISTATNTAYYALCNKGTISMINSGDFYHASGRANAVYNPDSQKYPTGYKLSTNTRSVTVTVPVWNAETSTYVDTELTYDCYFVAMKFYASNVYLGNNLDMMFAFPQNLVENWSNYYVVAVRTYADGTTEELTFAFDKNEWGTITIGEGDNAKAYYTVLYTGFAAKEMCDTITLTIYDGNGQKVSVECVDSIQKYAMRMLNQYANHETLRTMLVDMLNYGAACQTHFSYNNSEENLANAKLDETQQGYATKTVEWSQALYNPENDFFDGSNLITTSNIQFAVAFTNSADPTSFSYQFTNHWGNGVGNGFAYNEKDAYYYIDTLVVADARKPITITDGTQAGTWTDSIESYCYRMIHKEGVTDVQANVFTAFMKFSDSANAYLHNRGGVE